MQGPRRTILLADDNRDSREIYGTLFEHSGYRVMTASDGPSAVAAARAGAPDVVLLNLIMPGMDGHQVLKEIRSHPSTASVRCLFLTGDARPEQMGEALIEGADAYITKPAEPTRVLEMVEAILAEGE